MNTYTFVFANRRYQLDAVVDGIASNVNLLKELAIAVYAVNATLCRVSLGNARQYEIDVSTDTIIIDTVPFAGTAEQLRDLLAQKMDFNGGGPGPGAVTETNVELVKTYTFPGGRTASAGGSQEQFNLEALSTLTNLNARVGGLEVDAPRYLSPRELTSGNVYNNWNELLNTLGNPPAGKLLTVVVDGRKQRSGAVAVNREEPYDDTPPPYPSFIRRDLPGTHFIGLSSELFLGGGPQAGPILSVSGEQINAEAGETYTFENLILIGGAPLSQGAEALVAFPDATGDIGHTIVVRNSLLTRSASNAPVGGGTGARRIKDGQTLRLEIEASVVGNGVDALFEYEIDPGGTATVVAQNVSVLDQGCIRFTNNAVGAPPVVALIRAPGATVAESAIALQGTNPPVPVVVEPGEFDQTELLADTVIPASGNYDPVWSTALTQLGTNMAGKTIEVEFTALVRRTVGDTQFTAARLFVQDLPSNPGTYILMDGAVSSTTWTSNPPYPDDKVHGEAFTSSVVAVTPLIAKGTYQAPSLVQPGNSSTPTIRVAVYYFGLDPINLEGVSIRVRELS